MSSPEQKLAGLGITLPTPMAAVANYVPYVITGSLLHVSGQVSADANGLVRGRLGDSLDLAAGQALGQQIEPTQPRSRLAATGDLGRISRVVKLGGFVNAAPDFVDIPQVINGCSDLMVDVFGDAGRHARFAVASPVLPLGVAVEIDGIFELG